MEQFLHLLHLSITAFVFHFYNPSKYVFNTVSFPWSYWPVKISEKKSKAIDLHRPNVCSNNKLFQKKENFYINIHGWLLNSKLTDGTHYIIKPFTLKIIVDFVPLKTGEPFFLM